MLRPPVRWSALCLAVWVVGCDGGAGNADDDIVEVCSLGVPTHNASATISTLVLDGLTLIASFDPEGQYTYDDATTTPTGYGTATSTGGYGTPYTSAATTDSGDTGDTGSAATGTSDQVTEVEPAACFDAASNTAVLVFEVGEVPFGRIRVRGGTTVGNVDLLTGNPISVEIFGTSLDTTFGGPDFVDGTYYVRQLGFVDVDVTGNAVNGAARRLSLAASIQVDAEESE